MIQSQEILYDSRYGNLTPEVAEKIRKSREEVKKLKGRALKCPVCGFRIEEIYASAAWTTERNTVPNPSQWTSKPSKEPS